MKRYFVNAVIVGLSLPRRLTKQRKLTNVLIPYLSLPVVLVAIGCGINTNPIPITQTPTQATNTPGNAPSCSACAPAISLDRWSAGLKPGASTTFSATVYYLSDPTVTWTVKEGSAGGDITDAGVYTAPLTEGVYHVTATSKANDKLSQSITIAVTATEFIVTDSTARVRIYHTASLLPSGQVLIAGGMDDDYDFADPSELYDPATSTFRYDIDEPVARIQHTATVLANGDVLLAGGNGEVAGSYGPMSTADLRKAESGQIHPTGSMNSPRSSHTATLLQDGRVLLAGGTNANGKPTQTAELYDPTSGKFTSAGDMTTPRAAHSAVLLPNGTVLIVGGTRAAAGAELYDPATNSFHSAPSVAASLCWSTAVLLADGRVLIAGGYDCSNTALDTAEIYDPSTGKSAPTGKLAVAQSFESATLLPDGRVLLVGGSVENLSQLYDPTTGSFSFGPHLTYPRGAHTATLLLDGRVFIVGGDSPYAEIYK